MGGVLKVPANLQPVQLSSNLEQQNFEEQAPHKRVIEIRVEALYGLFVKDFPGWVLPEAEQWIAANAPTASVVTRAEAFVRQRLSE